MHDKPIIKESYGWAVLTKKDKIMERTIGHSRRDAIEAYCEVNEIERKQWPAFKDALCLRVVRVRIIPVVL